MRASAPILVGTDGSESARTAVRWAAVEAQRRAAELTVLHVYDEDRPTTPGRPSHHRRRAEAIISEARTLVRGTTPAVAVRTEISPGDPAAVLLGHATSTGLVVLGHRGRGGFTRLLLGSVSQRVATRAACTTVVTRGRILAFDDPVVVGADDSPGGRVAIETAFTVADMRRTVLLAVRAYREPLPPVTPGLPLILPVDMARLERGAEQELARMLEPWRLKFPNVPVATSVGPGTAARTLVGASHRAQLLVVGAGDAGRMGGSVAAQLLHHADCPVMIAR